MVACGVPQALLQNGSDYEKFCVYARCMPLCKGHSFLQADAHLIERLLGQSIPICPESCDALWHAAAFCLSGLGEPFDLPKSCHIPFAEPVQMRLLALQLGNALYASPTAALLTALQDARAVSVSIPMTVFVKPNPYAAKQALSKLERGEVLVSFERDLLAAQTLRVLGKQCMQRDIPLYVYADFQKAQAWQALFCYLQTCECLPQIVLVVSDEAGLLAAAQTVGCVPNQGDIPQIRVGVASVPNRQELLDLYATVLPIGILPPTDQ